MSYSFGNNDPQSKHKVVWISIIPFQIHTLCSVKSYLDTSVRYMKLNLCYYYMYLDSYTCRYAEVPIITK